MRGQVRKMEQEGMVIMYEIMKNVPKNIMICAKCGA